VAAYLINIYSGRKVSEFVGDRIFKFLNMTSSTYKYGDALASGHLSDAFDDIGRRVPNPLGEHAEMWSGPGGVISNVVDLGNWLMYLLHDAGDAPSGGLPWDILSETWRPYMFVKPPAPAPFNGTITYGIGWFQATYRGHEVGTKPSLRHRLRELTRTCTEEGCPVSRQVLPSSRACS
jgi:CubicO group peptidase (beta-lactamase class C family)